MIDLIIALLLAQPQERYVERVYSPREAVAAAADAEGRPVPGVFAMRVLASGRDDGRLYLNSELDYRDQRNLSIEIDPRAEAALAQRVGMPLNHYFKGRLIHILGHVQRVRINFLSSGRPTGKYYYQTHVRVNDPAQIREVTQVSPRL